MHNCNSKGLVVNSKQAKEVAESKGQDVFSNKKSDPKFITKDVGVHNGGAFKGADTAKDLGRKETRKGTFDKDLKRIGD